MTHDPSIITSMVLFCSAALMIPLDGRRFSRIRGMKINETDSLLWCIYAYLFGGWVPA